MHPVFGEALRAVPAELRPEPPYHLGGPRPLVSGPELLAIGLDGAQRIRPWVRGDRRRDFKRAIEVTSRLLELPADATDARRDAVVRELSMLSRVDVGPNVPAQCAPMLCTGALNVVNRFTDRAMHSISRILARTATIYAEHLRDETHDYLQSIDVMVTKGECRDAMRKYAPDHVGELEEVLFRADRGNGVAGHFAFRLTSGDMGLIAKIKGRYRFFRGSRDDVFATLPDSLLEAAHAALAD